MVRADVEGSYRPDSADFRDTEQQERAKFEMKVNETFKNMKKSSKINKLLNESF